MFWHRRINVSRRWREAAALGAVCCSVLLLLHTRDLGRDALASRPYDYTPLANRIDSGASKVDDTVPEQKSSPSPSGGQSAAPSSATSRRQVAMETSSFLESVAENSLEENDVSPPEARRLNNTLRADIELLVFNRVPKVGSQTLMALLRKLSTKNNFHFHSDGAHRVETVRLGFAEQHVLAGLLSKYVTPATFTKHIAYINFTRFGLPNPIYMNLVRDPVERMVSWYYYVRAPWYIAERRRHYPDMPLPDPDWLKKDFESCVRRGDRECLFLQDEINDNVGDHRRQVLFFCGQDPECRPFNGAKALEGAKRVVERQYSVVGVLEDINATLVALERYIPRFFTGALKAYYEELADNNHVNYNAYKPYVSEEVKDLVRANFTREIEFYQFCRQRLYAQLSALGDPLIEVPPIPRTR